MKVGTDKLVGNQVSLHATKRIPSRFLRDDGKHKGTFGDEEVVVRRDEIGTGDGIERGGYRGKETRDRGRNRVNLPYRYATTQLGIVGSLQFHPWIHVC